jgi:DNA-damage-inducible protein J
MKLANRCTDMGKTGYITARVEPKLKTAAGRVLAKVGVSTSDAITMFLRQVVLRDGLPFEVRVPNEETRKAIEELESPAKRAKLPRYATADEMFTDVLRKKGNRARKRA